MVKYPYKFAYSSAVEDYLIKSNIFLHHHAKISGIHKIGEGVVIKNPVYVEPFSTMCRKSFFSIGSFSYCRSPLEMARIGRYCSISVRVEIMGIDHPIDRIGTHIFTFRNKYLDNVRKVYGKAPVAKPLDKTENLVQIDNDVWIGQNVLIKPGLHIGNGSIIAAGSVVTKDVAPFSIVGGVPARVIKYRFDEKTRERASQIAWWQYHLSDFSGLDTSDPTAFLDGLEERIQNHTIHPYSLQRIELAVEIDKVINLKR